MEKFNKQKAVYILATVGFAGFVISSFVGYFISYESLADAQAEPFFEIILDIILTIPLIAGIYSLPEKKGFTRIGLFYCLFAVVQFFGMLMDIPFYIHNAVEGYDMGPIPELILYNLLRLLNGVIVMLIAVEFFRGCLNRKKLIILISLLALWNIVFITVPFAVDVISRYTENGEFHLVWTVNSALFYVSDLMMTLSLLILMIFNDFGFSARSYRRTK